MSDRVSLRGMLRLIRIDTLRRVNNVIFLVVRIILIPYGIELLNIYKRKVFCHCIVIIVFKNVR